MYGIWDLQAVYDANKQHTQGVIQTKSVYNGPNRQTISSTSPVGIQDLKITFTPYKANSKILVMAQICTSATHVSSFAIYKDGQPTVDTSGVTNRNQPNMQATTYIGSTTNGQMWSMPIIWSEDSVSTSPRTYQVYATAGWSGTTYTLYINNRSSNDMSSFSNMVIMEILE